MNFRSMKLFSFVIVITSSVLLFSQNFGSKKEQWIRRASDHTLSGKEREQAVRSLGEIGRKDTTVIPFLIGILAETDQYLAGTGAAALSTVGVKAVPALCAALQDENSSVRKAASIAIGKIGPPAHTAVPSLLQRLSDPDEDVQWTSLIALGNIGPRAALAIPVILPLLDSAGSDRVWAVRYALKHIDPAAMNTKADEQRVRSIIQSQLPELMRTLHVPGVSVVLVKEGAVQWSHHAGVKDMRTNEPVSSSTMFEACSMSKPVFALIVMRLAEARKIDLDKPLASYLDERFVSIDDLKNTVTARMVLSHTSGLPNWRTGYEEMDGPLPMYFRPGTRFSYSGEGFFYLQRVIERITGEPLDVTAEKLLARPLGLTHFSYAWSPRIDTLIAAGHDTSGMFRQKSRYEHPNSAYSLCVSAEQFAKVIGAMMNAGTTANGFITKASVDEMRKAQVGVAVREPVVRPGRAKGLSVSWGLGWGINETVSGDILYHSGANQSGFRCYSQIDLRKRSGIVIMTNGVNGSELWQRLIRQIGDF
jgi:CubicO group peptidase (beta-lactamase class C family)